MSTWLSEFLSKIANVQPVVGIVKIPNRNLKRAEIHIQDSQSLPETLMQDKRSSGNLLTLAHVLSEGHRSYLGTTLSLSPSSVTT